MKIKMLCFLMLIVIAFMPVLLHAQVGGPGGDPDVPIDGGLCLLMAAGVGYVVKKGYDKRKKTKQIPE